MVVRFQRETGQVEFNLPRPRPTRMARSKEDNMGTRSSNDDRADEMNPNNDAYWASLNNHANQMNSNNDEYRGNDREDEDRK